MKTVSEVNVSTSASESIVLDIEGCNSFILQCSVIVRPFLDKMNRQITYTWDRNDTIISVDKVARFEDHADTVFTHTNEIQQVANAQVNDIIYKCTVGYSLNGVLIAANTSEIHITVKGGVTFIVISPDLLHF